MIDLLSVELSWLQFFEVETLNFVDKRNYFWYRYTSNLKSFHEIVLSNGKFCSFLNTDDVHHNTVFIFGMQKRIQSSK